MNFFACPLAAVPFVIVLLASPTMAEDVAPVGNMFDKNPGDWEFVAAFSDEFDTDVIDTRKWNINTEDWGTWSWEPENAFQKGGTMHLQMVQQNHQRGNLKLFYKSGIARTHGTTTYGYYEARVKGCSIFPGACPSFWLHSKGPQNRYQAKDGETVSYSEIDIIELQQGEWDKETKQNNGVEVIDCNLHTVLQQDGKGKWYRPGTDPERCKNEVHASFDPREDFHVYGCENNPDFVIWYIDGEEVARKPNLYWHLPMHVTLSLGLRRPFENYKGGQRLAIPEATTSEGFPTEMEVDYVRVWRNTKVEAPVLASATQKGGQKKMKKSAGGNKQAKTDWSREDFVAKEKIKWEQNGWNWNQEKVESNFAEIDADGDGVATGLERQAWYQSKKN